MINLQLGGYVRCVKQNEDLLWGGILIKIENKVGPSRLPWTTPAVISNSRERTSSTFTLPLILLNILMTVLQILPCRPNLCILCQTQGRRTLSNAFLMSNMQRNSGRLFSLNSIRYSSMTSRTTNNGSVVPRLARNPCCSSLSNFLESKKLQIRI